jgi:hypothetical protein
MSNVRRELASRMADAALALTEALDPDQRAIAQWPFDDHVERTRWFYTPTDHGGLPIAAMRPRQQQLTHRLVASGLSRAGYVTVATVMGLDNVLDAMEGWTAALDRERGRDPGMYFVRVFGDPSGSEPWGWRFGGHHVSVNHVIVDGEVVGSTPIFLGANPAAAPLLGPHPLRPLAGAEDLGRALVRSLDEEQLRIALLAPVAPTDLASANRSTFGTGAGDLPMSLGAVWRQRFDGEVLARMERAQARAEAQAGLTADHVEAIRLTRTPRGLGASEMRPEQRSMLRSLLDVYVHRVPDELAGLEAAKYATDDDLGSLRFAWAGGLEPGDGHYYRVQGADLLAEYDNSQDGANHVHTVWRNPRFDFGHDVLLAHYDAHQLDPGHGHDH